MLWLIGGKKETGETNEIWSGTPSGTGWIKIDVKGNNIWDARMQHSAATCNGLLFVFGGKKRTSATTQEYFYSSDPFSNLKGSDVWISTVSEKTCDLYESSNPRRFHLIPSVLLYISFISILFDNVALPP